VLALAILNHSPLHLAHCTLLLHRVGFRTQLLVKWISEPFTTSYGSVEKEEQLYLVGPDLTGTMSVTLPVSVHPWVENEKKVYKQIESCNEGQEHPVSF